MFGMFNFNEASASDIGYSVSFLAVIVVGLGYSSDILLRDAGFGPAFNGFFLTFGAALGIACLFLYYRFHIGLLQFNAYKAHMFDVYFMDTVFACLTGATGLLLVMIFAKRRLSG